MESYICENLIANSAVPGILLFTARLDALHARLCHIFSSCYKSATNTAQKFVIFWHSVCVSLCIGELIN